MDKWLEIWLDETIGKNETKNEEEKS